MSPVRDAPVVFLVDDDPRVLHAHARLLRADGLATATFGSAEAFLAKHDAGQPGCLVLEVDLPGLGGLELQRRLAETLPARRIVFVAEHGDVTMSVQAMKAGAVDFLMKPVAGEVLQAAVRAALAQDADCRRTAAEHATLRRRLSHLSGRERQVLQHLVAGRLNKQIAAGLGIAEATVKFHRGRLMRRMQAQTIAELMHAAARLGLVSPVAPAAVGFGAQSTRTARDSP